MLCIFLPKQSYFVAYGHPIVADVVSPAKYLQIVTVRHQFFDVFVYLCRFLTLAPSITENDVGRYVLVVKGKVAFVAHEACFFGMLKVKSMAFCYLPIDCLLDPVD
jgi:hypothetical protein